MQSINDAISVLDKFFVGKHFPVTREAYQTLKSAVLAAQTNNKQSTPPCNDTDCQHNVSGVCDGADCKDGMS